jgi:hypothetical protein
MADGHARSVLGGFARPEGVGLSAGYFTTTTSTDSGCAEADGPDATQLKAGCQKFVREEDVTSGAPEGGPQVSLVPKGLKGRR